MEKNLTIGEYTIPLKSTAATLISYKANFNRDGFKDLLTLARGFAANEKVTIDALVDSGFDVDVFFRFVWVLAKAANPEIAPLEEWLGQYDIPPFDFVSAALDPVIGLLTTTAQSKAKPKNQPAAAGKPKSQRK